METIARVRTAAIGRQPAGPDVATTATDIWNDSCAVDELEYAISYGAVGATANPTIVTDVWKADPAHWRDRVRTLAAERPDATEIDLAWAIVEEMSLRAAPLLRPAFEASGGRQGRLSMQTDPTLFRSFDRMLAQGEHFAVARPEHHRQVPGHGGRRPGHGGGDLPWRERQRHRVVQRRPGRRRRRGGRARAAPARGRGPAGRRHGAGHHGDDGPPRGLAAGPDRARRHRRRPDGAAVVRRRGLQADRRRVPRPRAPRAAARRGDPPPPALVGADRRRRRDHDAGRLAAPVQRLVGRGPAADGRPGRARRSSTSCGGTSRTSSAPTSRTGWRPPSSTRSGRARGRCAPSSGRTTTCSTRSATRWSRTRTSSRPRDRRPDAGLYRPAGSLAEEGWSVVLTPEAAGWRYQRAARRDARSRAGTIAFDSGADEVAVLPLEGGFEVDRRRRAVSRSRAGPTSGRARATSCTPRPARAVEVAQRRRGGSRVATARAERRYPGPLRAGLGRRGRDARRGRLLARGPQLRRRRPVRGRPADRRRGAVAGWQLGLVSAAQARRGPRRARPSSRRSTTTSWRDGPSGPGLAYQHIYGTPERPIDLLTTVATGDVVLVPHGWHGPAMAAPGYDLYYLNVMAGPGERAWRACDDPAHAWVRDAWADQAVDPRLPFGGAAPAR